MNARTKAVVLMLFLSCIFVGYVLVDQSAKVSVVSGKLGQGIIVSACNTTETGAVQNAASSYQVEDDAELLIYRPSTAKLFASTFVACHIDQRCRFMYHHVQKSGGTLLASRLHPVIEENEEGVNTGQPYRSKEWCCNENVMMRFHNRTDFYCNLKFGIYETRGGEFSEVIKTCRRDHSNGKRTREVILITVREPIQRTLSRLHQTCNRGYKSGGLNDKERKMCRVCSYAKHPEFFSSFVDDSNAMYIGIANAIRHILEDIRGTNSHLLILDSADINSFFRDVEQMSGRAFPSGRKNLEKTEICSFGMTSEMLRALAPAIDVYRNITLGNEAFQ